ncbi:MAG: chemotaxis protein CheW [Chromatiales bacterium]|nr:chemotaxis protein CheW [Chromatiales bacterium]
MSVDTAGNGASDELYSLLIPLQGARLLLPRTCVVEVLRNELAPDEAPAEDWLMGRVAWNGLTVPVISFERLAGLGSALPGPRTRIALVRALDGRLPGCFGVLTEGFPQLIRVNRQVLSPHDPHPWPADGPVLCQVRMINELPLLPDLDRIEELLSERL